jgi:hypothetical protein
MYKYSQSSKRFKDSCNGFIRRVLDHVIKFRDCKVTDGGRTVSQQRSKVDSGASRTMNSYHVVGENIREKADATDVTPYPVDYRAESDLLKAATDGDLKAFKGALGNIIRMAEFAGFVQGAASVIGLEEGRELEWGRNWDGDRDFFDQTLFDWPHLQEKGKYVNVEEVLRELGR